MRELPEGWGWKKLGEIGTIVAGGTPSTSEPTNFDGDISWITPADLSGYTDTYIARGRRNLSQVGLGKSSAKIVPKGTVLFTSRAPIGYVAIASQPLATNQGFKNLILEGDNILPEYIYYYLKSNQQIYSRYASGTTFLEISASKFSQIPAPIPPLDTQRKIVAILDKAEETRRLRAQANELTQTLLQSVFLEMFGDPLKNSKGLPLRKMGELAEITMGQSPPGESYNTSLEGVPFLQGKAEFGPYCPTVRQYTTQPSKMAKKGSILMSIRAPVGDVNIAQDDFCIGRGLASIYSDKMDMTYLYFYLKEIKPYIESLGTGSTFKAISGSILRSIPVIEPPLELQIEFHKFEAKHHTLVDRLSCSTNSVDSVSTSLISKAFTGELVA